jgi:Trk K+ transport system NAD-binding subunit
MGEIRTTTTRPARPGKAVSRRSRMPAAPAAAPAARPSRPAMRPTVGQRLRYRFDNALSRGAGVVIGWLALLTLGIFVVAGLAFWAFGLDGVNGEGPVPNPAEGIWQAMLRVVDAGTFAGDSSWPMRLLSFAVTIAGIFIAGSLIGLIANAVDQRIEGLRKGRSDVLESGHTVVLGWSPRIAAIVSELVVANASEKHAAVVVLGAEDKTVMEDALQAAVGDTGTTRLVCRSGSPAKVADLEMVNVLGARSVIVMSAGNGDADAIRAVLAIKTLDPEFAGPRVVAEISDPTYADSLGALTDGRVVTVNSDHVIAEITAQSCRQSGLSQVLRDLIDFDGDEIYFAPFPELTGGTYAEALTAFETSAVLGLARSDGSVLVNPPPDTVLQAGDEVIAVAEDDSTFRCTGAAGWAVPVPAMPEDEVQLPKRLLIVGWSLLGAKVVREFDQFAVPGTVVDVVVDPSLADPGSVRVEGLRHTDVRVHATSAGPEELALLVRDAAYDQGIVLSYRDAVDAADGDARTLLTLLALRRAWPAGGERAVRIVAEVLERDDVELVQAGGVDDWIVSDEVTSLMLAQLSERTELAKVFVELFDPDGARLSFGPAQRYVGAEPVPFGAVVAAGAARGQSVLGYRVGATGAVHLNPVKTDVITFAPADSVLVVESRAEVPVPAR